MNNLAFWQLQHKIILLNDEKKIENMDSLTARLLSRTGLNPIKPTLPPIHNMQVVHLKKDLTKAEKNLHEARLALDQLQEDLKTNSPTAQIIQRRQNALYDAMHKLQRSEADYFATKYIGRDNKTVLDGWEKSGKMKDLRLFLKEKVIEAQKNLNQKQILTGGNTSTYHVAVLDATNELLTAYQNTQSMNWRWYRNDVRIPADQKPPSIALLLDDVKQNAAMIRAHLRTALALPDNDPVKVRSVAEIKQIIREADVAVRIATMIDKNIWQLPYDLRVNN